MSVHPVMRQNFAGKPSPIFYNIWDPVISVSPWHGGKDLSRDGSLEAVNDNGPAAQENNGCLQPSALTQIVPEVFWTLFSYLGLSGSSFATANNSASTTRQSLNRQTWNRWHLRYILLSFISWSGFRISQGCWVWQHIISTARCSRRSNVLR